MDHHYKPEWGILKKDGMDRDGCVMVWGFVEDSQMKWCGNQYLNDEEWMEGGCGWASWWWEWHVQGSWGEKLTHRKNWVMAEGEQSLAEAEVLPEQATLWALFSSLGLDRLSWDFTKSPDARRKWDLAYIQELSRWLQQVQGGRGNPVRESLEPSPGLLLCFVSVVAFFSFHCKAQDVLPPRSSHVLHNPGP